MLLPQYLLDVIECGTDEAGRGCLAGPVTAAAVILPQGFNNPVLNDSKKLTHKQRDLLRPIIETEAVSFSVIHIDIDTIDKINILNASILGMQESIRNLQIKPEHIAVDGNRFKPCDDISYKCIIKGDGKYLNIASASILAKTYRDNYMEKIHEEFPMYNWKQNKGYPTKEHREAIRTHGPSKYHRKSFRLLPEQYQFNF